MKLRNKKTGEIVEKYPDRFVINSGEQIRQYGSLAELNEEWEDYEEPKEFYVVDLDGEILPSDFEDKTIKKSKEFGNYFETKEEAEKAVEKLKAWKRLKDKGFRFIDHLERDSGQGMTRYEWDGYRDKEDLDLLFGGEA